MMRLEDRTVQGQEGVRVLPPECVCGAGSSDTTRLAQPAVVPTCSECGGTLLRRAVSTGQERRRLQDFLSAFV